jgi:branched-chain amino acid transport system substrate-binding protein
MDDLLPCNGRTTVRSNHVAWMSAVMVTGALAIASVGGCSLLVNADGTQCQSSDECAARGSAFANTTCDAARRVCVPRARCETNQECIAEAGGEMAICRKRDHQCVVVRSEDCPAVIGPVESDDVILIGSIAPLSGMLAEVGVPVQQSLELAFKEINAVGAGIPLAGTDVRRPLALVTCDEAKDGARAAAHLAKDLEAVAILGPLNSGVALRVGPQVTVPAGALMFSPGATAPSLSRVSGGKLVWRTAASDTHQARALTELIPIVEAEHRQAWEIPDAPEDFVRVAMVVRGDSYGIELAQATIESGLQFNGLGLTANGPYFARVDYDDPATQADVDYARVVSFLTEFRPNIVILLSGPEGASQVIVPLEEQWPAGVAKPWYVLSHGARTPSLLGVATIDDDLRRRMRGTMAGRDNPQLESFALAYRGAHQGSVDVYGMAQAYDAAYLLAYGIAAGGAPVTGASIGEGLKKTSHGTEVSVGPGVRVSDTFDLLASGKTISFKGASGPYRFDPETGDSPFDVDVWCIGKGLDGAPIFRSSAQYYDVTAGKLAGDFACD